MIFSISKDSRSIARLTSAWSPRELEVENYILHGPESDERILNESIFGEELLLVSNQVRTRDNKRADLLALDRQGNGVIIELKRNHGSLGVETQALQYLADFSRYKGRDFIQRFSTTFSSLEELALGFLGDVSLESINKKHRVILVARSFDRALYSMGKWLGENGVAFRCIEYTPFAVQENHFISFSVAFDQSPPDIFPLSFLSRAREPAIFWHNIGAADQDWWAYLSAKNEIPASFENQAGDEGEQLLKSYVREDRIVAYAKGYGAVGWGVITKPDYHLVETGSSEDVKNGELRHRLSIQWKSLSKRLQDGISPSELRASFGISHPISTSVRIERSKAGKLFDAMNSRFKPLTS